jgi:hypothetical protein
MAKMRKWLIDLDIHIDENGDNEGENPKWLIDLKIFLDTNIDKEGEKI